ncbi:hypothetical protein Pmani_004126 [Petrolisthes manimaculis]|nr:hypothetical protein Pmani_004126 [Petrolisthes manimaculis]
MSFTEMAPSQRQVLMDLALTLSKDELYQRSKSIMRQQTRARGTPVTPPHSDSDTSTITSVLRATKRSFSRLGSRASTLKDKSPLRRLVPSRSRHNLDQIGQCGGRRIPNTPMPRRATSGYQSCSECGYDSECSSKCYCSLPRRVLSATPPHHPSCDCDTESCAESEKCYCSLKRVKKDGIKMYEINLDSETDTNTEATGQGRVGRGRGYSSHDESESRRSSSRTRSPGPMSRQAPSDTNIASASSRLATINKEYSTHDSRRSRKAPGPPLMLSPRLRRHPSGSLGSGGSQGSRGSSEGSEAGGSQQKILLVSAVDPSGKVVYRGASQQPRPRHHQSPDTASILSMKKTAEIAALFSELKLSQTTDLLQHHPHSPDHTPDHSPHHSDDDAYSTMVANNSFLFSDNIETSLGYLP